MRMLSRWSLPTLALSLLLSGCSLGSLMIHESPSPYGFEQTIATIETRARELGWLTPKAFDFQASLIEHGQPDPGRLTVIKLCSPQLASRMFASDDSRRVAVMAPCSMAVYEKADGLTYVSSIDMRLMARLMGGDTGEVMRAIAEDDDQILGFLNPAARDPRQGD